MRLLRSILDNIVTLLVSVVLAISIWVIAVQAEDPLETRTYEVPVEAVNLPAGSLLLNTIQRTVQVQVEGPQSALTRLTSSDFNAVVDLSDAPQGESSQPIQIQFSNEEIEPDQLTIAESFPAQVAVNVDRLVSAEVPVVLTVNGSVARGLERSEAFTDPDFITVTGPSSRVNALAEARVTVFLENQREDAILSRRPVFYDQSGNVATIVGLTLDNEQVEAFVLVNELAGFANKPITVEWVGQPAPGYNLLDVNVTPDSVLVTGSPSDLEALRFVQTERIDISGLKQSFTQQVSLALEDGIELDEVVPIFVEVVIEPRLGTAEVDKVPELRALGEGYTVTVDVDTVTVVLFGPVPVLDTLVEDDVRVTVDLFGLEPGEYSLPPGVDVFAEEIEVRSTDPAEVTVVITDVLTATNGITDTVPVTGTVPVTETLGGPAGAPSLVTVHSGVPTTVPYLAPQAPLPPPWRLRLLPI
jgi:YbbR domain-containing protein